MTIDYPLCGSIQDKYGYHALVRKHGGDVGLMHDQLRDSAFPYFQQAGLRPQKETPGLIRDSQERPGDIFVPSHRNGQGKAFDFAITNALQNKFVENAAAVSGGAAMLYAGIKRDKYEMKLLNQDVPILFQPLVMDAYGAWDPDALTSLKQIARGGSTARNQQYSLYLTRMMGKFSLVVMRGNARALLRRRVDAVD